MLKTDVRVMVEVVKWSTCVPFTQMIWVQTVLTSEWSNFQSEEDECKCHEAQFGPKVSRPKNVGSYTVTLASNDLIITATSKGEMYFLHKLTQSCANKRSFGLTFRSVNCWKYFYARFRILAPLPLSKFKKPSLSYVEIMRCDLQKLVIWLRISNRLA